MKSNPGIGQVLQSIVSLLPIDKKIWAIYIRTVVRLLLGIMRGATMKIMMTSLNSDNHLYDLDNHDYADNATW